jgi:hypothetical protein
VVVLVVLPLALVVAGVVLPLVLPLVLMAVLVLVHVAVSVSGVPSQALLLVRLAHVAVLVLLPERVPRLPLHVAQCVTARLSLGKRIRLSPLWTYTF